MTSRAFAPSPYNTPLSVNDETPVPPCVTAKSFVNVTVPVTLKLSSTVTVPPAESRVKFPEAVSISFPPEIALGVMVIAAAPGGVTSNILTKFADGDVALSLLYYQ